MTWKIRYTGLAEACEVFELELPVEIKRTAQYRSMARYRHVGGFAAEREVHSITISTFATAAEANRALMHELAHARQWEEAYLRGDEAKRRRYRLTRMSAYDARASEAEAREWEAFADEITAIVPEGWTAGLHGHMVAA